MADIDPKYRAVSDFAQPARALPTLEQNLQAALGRIAQQAHVKLVPTGIKTEDYQAKLDELVLVDTSTGSTVKITLPVTSSSNAGREVGIERLSAAGVIFVQSLSDIDGSGPSITLPLTEGQYRFTSDGRAS